MARYMGTVGRSPSSTIAMTMLYGTAMAWMVTVRDAPIAAMLR